MSGPLTGVRVVEMAGIGPLPMAAMLFADLGATVLRIERLVPSGLGIPRPKRYVLVNRNRKSVAVDLKATEGIGVVLDLIAKADILIEGFRPGTMERLGLAPDICLSRNPRLVYGRMTGWGQQGPMAPRAGHDINYIALTGVLHAIGRKGEAPVPPLNLVGDFGGGGMMLAFGIACGIIEAQRSGRGQVVDAAMVDGASTLAAMFAGMLARKNWTETRGDNVLDTGAPWYDTYATADGKYVAIGSIEAKFYAELLQRMGLDPATLPKQHDRKGWPALRERFAATFKTKTRDEWARVFDGSDACFAPVLTFSEARQHPHMAGRGTFINVGQVNQPAPSPRFSRTPGAVRNAAPERGQNGREALEDWGFTRSQVESLKALGLGCAD